MTESHRALSEVPALLEERRRYESWLAALEARRESTPAHVYERVLSDYQSRLRQVVERLAAHRGALSEERASIESRISLLEAEAQMRRDERAELDLRLQVGELSAAEAAEALRALDATLGELDGEKTTLRVRVDTVRELLDERRSAPPPTVAPPVAAPQAAAPRAPAGPPPAAPAPQPPQPAPVAPPVVAQAPIAQSPVAQPPAAHAPQAQAPADHVPHPAPRPTGAVPAPTAGSSFDELAFLSSVVGSERAATEARRTPPRSVVQEKLAEAEAAAAAENAAVTARVAAPPPVTAPAPAPQAPVQPQVSHRPSVPVEARRDAISVHDGHAESPLSGVRGSGTGVVREPAASEALLSALGARKSNPGDVAPLAANVPGNTPIVLRASGAHEHSKTLKCNDCGAMNYATEWYCERCGAELAAL